MYSLKNRGAGGGGAKSDVLTRTSALFIGRVTMEVGTLVATIERAVKTQMTPGSQCSCAVKIGQAIQTVTGQCTLLRISLALLPMPLALRWPF